MGTRIEAACTARPRARLGGTGAIALADEAARACLRQAGRTAGEVDFLVNAGVYRDNNIGEPAVAAIIQQDIGANPDPPLTGGHGTFSFDVVNGAVGVLNAVHVLDGFLASGAIDVGLVVASDQDPERGSHWDFPFGLVGLAGRVSRGSTPRFPYDPVGAALLLSRTSDEGRGFARFAFSTFPEYQHLLRGEVSWEEGGLPHVITDAVPGLHAGKNVLHVHEMEGFAERGAECAVATLAPFLRSAGLSVADVDLFVPSPSPVGFADALARALQVPADRMALVDERASRVHTAGPVVALEAAMRSGRFASARHVLFVAMGSGLTIGLALYRP